MPAKLPRIAIVAGEASGDQLGASLLRRFRAEGFEAEVAGVGGAAMEAEGFRSLFPQSDIAVMGVGPVIRRLPTLLRRIRETADSIISARPDLLLTIDSPDFCKRVAKRVRARAPEIPIVHWVCPSVWAWRPRRAPAMRPYVDRILCLLPFEPDALLRLHGPEGVFVGHPLIERLDRLTPSAGEQRIRDQVDPMTILLLPGSRQSEIRHLLKDFLIAARMAAPAGARFLLPTLPHIAPMVRALVVQSGLPVEITTSEDEKHAAFRQARAALAASGTVTLELALARIPMVTAYRMANWEAAIARRLITASSAILPNLILGENIIPEFIQEAVIPADLAASLAAILPDGAMRQHQLTRFDQLEAIMRASEAAPSARASAAIRELIRRPI